MMDSKWIFAVIYLLCAALLMVPGAENGEASGAPITDGTSESAPPLTGQADTTDHGTREPMETETPMTQGTGGETSLPDSDSDGGSDTEPRPMEPVAVTVYLHDQKRTVEMELEEYVMRVVMAEMPYTFHAQALKAQAVAVRSYCLYRMEHGADHGDSGGQVCDDYSHCMALMTEEAAVERWGEETAARIEREITKAIADTAGQVLTWDGRIIAAMFHASSTGKTENAVAVWGNEYPYLVSVESGEEPRISEMSVSMTELRHLLRIKGESDFAASLWDGGDGIRLKHNESGRVEVLSYGGYKMSGIEIRRELGLKSTDFSVEISKDGLLALFTVTGSGHGLGMSQYGAQAMAEAGDPYEAILSHYYRESVLGGMEAFNRAA